MSFRSLHSCWTNSDIFTSKGGYCLNSISLVTEGGKVWYIFMEMLGQEVGLGRWKKVSRRIGKERSQKKNPKPCRTCWFKCKEEAVEWVDRTGQRTKWKGIWWGYLQAEGTILLLTEGLEEHKTSYVHFTGDINYKICMMEKKEGINLLTNHRSIQLES